MRMRTLGVLCFLFFSAPLVAAEIELIPTGRPFRRTFADPREIRMALSLAGDSKLNAIVGNYFSLLSFEPEEENDWTTHFGLEGAGYFTMRQAQRRFPLETADGLIGMYVEAARGPWQWQLRFTHISAHLADGSDETSIPYSREMLIGRVGWEATEELYFYAGSQWLTHTVPVVPALSFQLGGSFFLEPGTRKLTPFLAFDLKWRRESEYDPSFSYQLGLALNNPPESYRSFRFFYSYYTGADPRGQFYLRPYTAHSLGIEMQI